MDRTELLNQVRQRLFEMQNELQAIAGELLNMAGDYSPVLEHTDGLYRASEAVNKAMGEVKAAALQIEEWNMYE